MKAYFGFLAAAAALTLVGVAHGAWIAGRVSPALGIGVGIAGLVLSLALMEILGSERATDGDSTIALFLLVAGNVAGFAVAHGLSAEPLVRGLVAAGAVAVPAAALAVRIRLRARPRSMLERIELEPGATPLDELRARAALGDPSVLDTVLWEGFPEKDAFLVVRDLDTVALVPIEEALGRERDAPRRERLVFLLGALGRVEGAYRLAAEHASPPSSLGMRAAALRALAEIDPRRALALARVAEKSDDPRLSEAARLVIKRAAEAE